VTYDGQDFSTFASISGVVSTPSMDLSFTPIGGVQAAKETILRKLRSPPGSFDDEAWGVDLRTYQNAALGANDLSAIQSLVASAVEAEEYVDSASVEVYLVDGQLLVDCAVTLADDTSFTMAFALTTDGIEAIVDSGA